MRWSMFVYVWLAAVIRNVTRIQAEDQNVYTCNTHKSINKTVVTQKKKKIFGNSARSVLCKCIYAHLMCIFFFSLLAIAMSMYQKWWSLVHFMAITKIEIQSIAFLMPSTHLFRTCENKICFCLPLFKNINKIHYPICQCKFKTLSRFSAY